MIWRARNFEFSFPRPTLLMGILNVTPDSFSDGGEFFQTEGAVEHAVQMIAEGADVIDIGGESTRPGAAPVSESEELRRVLPVLQKLVPLVKVPVSIDTRKPNVARAALEAGASIINDIAAHREDPAMWRLAGQYGAGYIAMHMRGSPENMQQCATYGNVVEEIGAFFEDRLKHLQGYGVQSEQIVLDVGIGFAKTAEHNLQLLGALAEFKRYGRPLLLGASRKSFVGRVTNAPEMAARLPGSLACACWGVMAGAHMLRVHDVAATWKAVRMIEAIQAQAR